LICVTCGEVIPEVVPAAVAIRPGDATAVKCGEVIPEVVPADGLLATKSGNGRERLKGLILALFGILAFLGGVWYFASASSSPVGSTEPTPRATEVSALSGTAATSPTRAAAETASTPAPDPDDPPETVPVPTANPRLTRANFDQIREGMTEEEVQALLGKPTGAKVLSDPGKHEGRKVTTLQWSQHVPFASIDVDFIAGLARAKTTTLTPAAPGKEPAATSARSQKPQASPAGSSKLTREKFEQIRNGMTEEEVLAILGPPSGSRASQGTYNGNPYQMKSLLWKEDNPNRTITVKIRDYKVSGKNWIQNDPKPQISKPQTAPRARSRR
jgi:hypothetical protein